MTIYDILNYNDDDVIYVKMVQGLHTIALLSIAYIYRSDFINIPLAVIMIVPVTWIILKVKVISLIAGDNLNASNLKTIAHLDEAKLILLMSLLTYAAFINQNGDVLGMMIGCAITGTYFNYKMVFSKKFKIAC